MITRVVGPGRTVTLDVQQMNELRGAYARCAIDVGTGDGRFAYDLASARPDTLVIGLDTLDEPMGEVAAKAARKPPKGGRANLVLVRAAAEAPPDELLGIADEIYVNLPWGVLLEGIVLGTPAVLEGLAALGTAGAVIEVILNGEIWLDSTPQRYASLPKPTPEHVAAVVAPAFANAGITIGPALVMTAAQTKALRTTWSRKLGHGREPTFVRFTGEVTA